jgi:phosphate transport system substrate-binding protein
MYKYSFYLVFLVSLVGCASKQPQTDVATMGAIGMVADETLRPIVDAEATVFQHLYKYATLNIQYLPETDIIRKLVADSTEVAVMARQLSDEEKNYFAQKHIIPRHTHIANDAIALVVHPENPDTALTYKQVLGVFSNEYTQWRSINPQNNLGDIHIVFDNAKSSTLHGILKLTGSTQVPKQSYSSENIEGVLSYVATHPSAIGVVSWCWMSDSDDRKAQDILRKVRVVAVSPAPQQTTSKGFYYPYQANVVDSLYPFIRPVYVLSTEGRTGLGTGFAAFAASEKGQRIILKSGILPAIQPTREIQIKIE